MLALERAEELKASTEWKVRVSNKQLSATGMSLTRLVVADRRTGLYGRVLVTFHRSGGGSSGIGDNRDSKYLPPHRFTPRDIVQLGAGRGGGGGNISGRGGSAGGGGDSGSGNAVTGVVYRVRPDSITVAFDAAAAVDDRLTDGGGSGGSLSLTRLFNGR